MAKEKQEPYEFLSNLVLALMATDRIFSNSFFTSELDISPKTLSEIRRGEDMCMSTPSHPSYLGRRQHSYHNPDSRVLKSRCGSGLVC